ncbi:hypothetical protein N0K08_05850 [Acidovorax sp. Be4]|uniref:Uncharacterized protein n=1 Tax=Acidovorax bellezanensis TaxID=2976702 RepID=A0ABT2PI39_9BURK|nr:hypothetical protein [Acidovorax sp. Be4]MCT9810146.1 hypothetical protein [Acidovorax sp. Be4]
MANKATFSSEQQAERLGAALRCTYEVESIAMHLNDNLPTEPEYMFLRSLVLRIFDLNSVAMSALDKDQTRTTADLWGVINRGGGCA